MKERIAAVVITLLLFVAICPLYAQSHLFGGITQAAVDKVINEASYPVTLVDQSALFQKAKKARTFELTGQQVQALLDEAKTKGCPNKDARLACAMQRQQEKFDRVVAEVKAKRQKAGNKWQGVSADDLEAQARGCFDTRVVVTHLNVTLLDAPTVAISGSGIAVSNVHLSTDVTVELQSRLPQFICTKTCHIGPIEFCCEGHIDCTNYQTVLTVNVRDIKTTTAASVALATAGAKVLGTPALTKLTIHIPVIGDVDVTDLVNMFLKPKQMTLYDAGQLVASVPILKTTYKVQSVTLSGAGELRVDVTIAKK